MKTINTILLSDNEILLGKEIIFVWRNNPKYNSERIRFIFAIWQDVKRGETLSVE